MCLAQMSDLTRMGVDATDYIQLYDGNADTVVLIQPTAFGAPRSGRWYELSPGARRVLLPTPLGGAGRLA